jgi:hypothetical protein
MPISIAAGFAEPIASRKRSVGDARPEASTTRSAARFSRVLEAHPRNRAIVGRGGQLRHTRSRSQLDIPLSFDSATADALDRGARQAELIEAKVALRERIEARRLEAQVASNAHPNGARLDEIELDARKQAFERTVSARKECMCKSAWPLTPHRRHKNDPTPHIVSDDAHSRFRRRAGVNVGCRRAKIGRRSESIERQLTGWQLLATIDSSGVDSDQRGARDGWEASPHKRFERLLRETRIGIGVLVWDKEIRLAYALCRTGDWLLPMHPAVGSDCTTDHLPSGSISLSRQ